MSVGGWGDAIEKQCPKIAYPRLSTDESNEERQNSSNEDATHNTARIQTSSQMG